MRWGLLSLVAATMLKLTRRRLDAQPRLVYAIAIALVALIFAAGHLPAASVIAPLDAPLVIRILVLNGIAGVIYGALFWRRSLEAAMAAHMATHVAFAIARLMRWA
jgi:membrane protease YdiL (CAAX protease family)